MSKKLVIMVGLATLLFIFTFAALALGAESVKLVVDGQEIKADTAPQIINGRVMVPIRWVSEALGASVSWDEKSRTVNINSVPGEENEMKSSIVHGSWMGKVEFSGQELDIAFNISVSPEGSITASMDSPDQGVMNIPADKVEFNNGDLRIELLSGYFIYEGKVKEGGQAIEGKLMEPKQGVVLPLVLERIEKAPELVRPQVPQKPYPYLEEEVAFENSQAGVTLAGTLTMPSSGGPFPAVLLITGSGGQNRDEEVFGHRPFLVLSDYLTRQGIAVLRVDDRGIGKSTGDFLKATSEDLAGDVLAGVQYLKNRSEINPSKIGLIGHSEGGMIAPMVAARSSDVAYIVLMAGPGVPGDELITTQAQLILRASGTSEETIAKNAALLENMFKVIKTESDDVAAVARLRSVIEEAVQDMTPQEKQLLGYAADNAIDKEVNQLLSPWLRYFISHDPKEALMKVKVPVLAINGEKDLQVPPGENLGAIEEALKAGGNTQYTIKTLPNLNHPFQTVQSGSGMDYGKIEETMSPVALKIIGDWVKDITAASLGSR